MAKLKLRGKDLRDLGYPEGPVISIAMQVMEKNFKFEKEEEAMNLLKMILASPVEYENDAVLGLIAQRLRPRQEKDGAAITLNPIGIPFNVFGADQIEQSAMHQMHLAAKLPVAVAGALMPDAHAGYGLPIGGVLVTDNAVIPYGVGVDIGCRMCLSVYDIDPKELVQREQYFTRELNGATLFGSGRQFDQSTPHEVMDRKEFGEIGVLKTLQARAARQLGSSGSGGSDEDFEGEDFN